MADVGMQEWEAIRRAKGGDDAGYEVLYRLHKRRVYLICLRSTRSVPDAEDLTQEVFLQVYRRLATFRGEAPFGSWLYKIAVNCSRMRFRRGRSEVSTGNTDAVEQEGGTRMSGLDLERALLGRAIAKLSRSKRRIVLLHDVEGLTHKEVARRLGLAVSTSKSQLSRAHLLLRKVFGGATKGHKGQHFEQCTNSGCGA